MISLVIVNYNQGHYLEKAIASIVKQTRSDWELLIWDDGSTDNSVAIAREYEQKDNRIRVIATTHQGVAKARKDAISKTTGDYIGWVDSDDWIANTALQETAKVLDSNPEVGMVYTDYYDVNSRGKILGKGKRCNIPYSPQRLLVDFMTFHFRLIRREVYEQIGGINTDFKYVYDYDLCLRVSEITEIAKVLQPLYYYRYHCKSRSAKYRKQRITWSEKAINQALQRRGLADSYILKVEGDRFYLRKKQNKVFAPLAPQPWREKAKKSPEVGGFRGHNFLKTAVTLIATLPFTAAISLSPASAQQIIPNNDGTMTVITKDGNTFNIDGGTLSGDGKNLFHSFQEFGLDAGQIANFLSNPNIQNILGRINGGNPSIINGLIQVTGGNSNLFLMNPSGIIFGNNASLNVPGDFTATTATGIGFGNGWFNAIGTNDYLNLVGNPNNFDFANSESGVIINAGDLKVADDSNISLTGRTVINTGTIETEGGNITVAAVPGTNRVRISQEGRILSLEVAIPQDVKGKALPIRVVDLPNLLRGLPVDVETGLEVAANNNVTVANSNTVIPNEPDTTVVSGKVDASNSQPRSVGGEVNILGDKVGLIGADVDASGDGGGGTVLVGGDYKGEGTVRNSNVTLVDRDSTIKADALQDGDGGKVIAWSDSTTIVHGNISAKGGINSGDGGFVETSSTGFLDIQTTPDVSASNGIGGTWLIDPHNIRITDIDEFDADIGTENPFTATGDDVNLWVGYIQDALTGGANVVVSTGTTGTQEGNITLAADLDFDGTGTNSLTLEAANNIFIGDGYGGGQIFDSIPTSPDTLNLTLTADSDDNNSGGVLVDNQTIATGGGNIVIEGSSDNNPGVEIVSDINSAGGNITITGTSIQEDGVFITTGQLSSEAGNIIITGNSLIEAGIESSFSPITSTSGNITLIGNSTEFFGVTNTQIANISSTSGAISITGTSADTFGVNVSNATQITSGSGAISIRGISNSNDGIQINFGSLTTGNNITLTGNRLDLTNAETLTADNIVIQPEALDQNIEIAGLGYGTSALEIAQSDLDIIEANSITIGRVDGTGTLTVANNAFFNDPVTLQAANINVNGRLEGRDNASITLIGAGTTTTLNADITTQGQPILIDDNVILGANVNLNTTEEGAAGANITIEGTVNNDPDPDSIANSLTLTVGTGNINITGAIGDTNPIGDIDANSSSTTTFGSTVNAESLSTDASGTNVLNGNITTTGTQFYGDAVELAQDVELVGGGYDSITFNSTVRSQNTPRSLTITTNEDSFSNYGTAFNGAVGDNNQPLSNLEINSDTSETRINGGPVTTTESQTYNTEVDINNFNTDTQLIADSDNNGSGNFSSQDINGNRQNLSIQAETITTGNIDNNDGEGGTGNIDLSSPGNITTGYIDGAEITVDSNGVDDNTQGLFTSTATLPETNISIRGTNVIIEHGGGNTNPRTSFIVGNATTNGTAGDIVSGTETVTAEATFTESFVSENGTIQILTPDELPIVAANDGTGSVVTAQEDGVTFDLTGGLTSDDGQNLFHSYTRFDLPESNQTANFIANDSLENILARVTSGDASDIQGTIQVTGGNPNLFLLNPAGIIFGSTAQINVPAAFTVTTGNGMRFGDNWFSASGAFTPLNGTPDAIALTMNNPGAIINNADLTNNNGALNLVGGTVVNSGNVTSNGFNAVALNEGASIINLSDFSITSTEGVTNLPNTFTANILTVNDLISLINEDAENTITVTSATDVLITNNIDTDGGAISITSGGTIDASTAQLISSSDERNGGDITLEATNDIQIGGIDSSVFGNSSEANRAGDINIKSSQGGIFADREIIAGGETGDGGNITLEAQNNIQILSAVSSSEAGSGGDITITSTGGAINTTQTAPNPNNPTETSTFGLLLSGAGNQGQNGGNISLTAPGNITTGFIYSGSLGNGEGGIITLESTGGSINTVAGANEQLIQLSTSVNDNLPENLPQTIRDQIFAGVSSFSLNNAGNINFTANNGNITTSNINAASTTATGGTIAFSASGNLTSQNVTTTNNNINLQGNENIASNGNIASGTGNITFTGNEIDLATGTTVTGSNVTLQPETPSLNIAIAPNTESDNTLDITQAELDTIEANAIAIDNSTNGTGTITVANPVTVDEALTLNSSQANLNGDITTEGLTINSNVNLQDDIALNTTSSEATGADININGSINRANDLTLDAGSGNITIQGTTGTRETPLGELEANSTGTTSFGGAINATGITTNSGGTTTLNGNVTTTGDQTFNDNVITATATELNSSDGNITTQNITTSGNDLNIVANSITTQNLTTQGGNVELESREGKITTGNIDSSGTTGGNITLNSANTIATEAINASGTNSGGDVTLNSGDNSEIQIGSIRADSVTNSNGGEIKVNAESNNPGLFVAKSTFPLEIQNSEIQTSIYTNSSSEQAITIKHGGRGAIPFEVAEPNLLQRDNPNGTVGAIIGGNSQIDDESFLFTEIRDTIGIISVDADEEEIARVLESSQDTTKDLIDSDSNQSFVGVPSLEIPSIPDAQQKLMAIASQAAQKPALVYINFTSPEIKARTNNPEEYFERAENCLTAEYKQALDLTDTQVAPTICHATQPTDKLEILVVTSEGEPIYLQSEVTREEVEEQAEELYLEVADAEIGWKEPAKQLYKWLIADIEDELVSREIDNLLFVLPPKLRSLPLASLYDGNTQEFLVQKGYNVGLAPSINLMNTIYEEEVKDAAVLALGASDFTEDQQQVPLNAVEVELSEIVNLRGGNAPLINERFTLKNLQNTLNNNSLPIVHLATHANFDTDSVDNIYIQLYDRKLTLDELKTLNLKVGKNERELLVLSACRSAFGNVDAELGFAGLAVKLGFKTAIGSLWYVEDIGTLALMIEFYHHLKTAPSKAEALKLAQLAMRNDDNTNNDQKKIQIDLGNSTMTTSWGEVIELPKDLVEDLSARGITKINLSHPYYWAPFTVIGSPW